jgi:hypothetical protein
MLYGIEVKRRALAPTLAKSKVQRLGVVQKFVKTKQNEAKTFYISQDRSETKVFVINCEEEKRG